MAFLFNGPASDTDEEEGKQNIFAGEQAAPSGQAPGAGGAVEKTSTEGGNVSRETSSSSGGQAPAQKVQAGSGGYNPKAAQTSYQRLAQQVQLPTQNLQKAQESVQAGQQQLQDEANKYAQAGQAQAQKLGASRETIEKAAGGEEGAYKEIAERLRSTTPQAEAFGGIGAGPNVQNIRNLEQAYKGPGYTAGQRRFDAALLRRSPEFRKLQAQILGQQSALQKEAAEKQTSLTEAQQAALEAAQTGGVADIRSQLGGMATGITDKAKAAEAAEELKRAGMDPSTIGKEEYAKLKQQLMEDLTKRATPGSLQARSLQYLEGLDPGDLGQYVNINKDVDYRDYLDQQEAEKYNRIQGLLGNQGELLQAGGGPGEAYSFNRGAAYQDILDQLTAKRGAADIVSQKEIDDIMKAAGERATAMNERGSVGENAAEQIAQYHAQKYNVPIEAARGLAQQFVMSNPNLITERNPSAAVQWQDELSAEQANRLNELTKDIGGMDMGYKAGYAPGYDQTGLQSAYDEFIRGLSTPAQAPTPAPAATAPSRTTTQSKPTNVRTRSSR